MEYTDSGRIQVMAEYKALHEQRPDGPYPSYLYAVTLLGRDTPQAIKLFNTALENDPSFRPPHLEFIGIYSSSA
jgi:hypothetical protein